MTEAPPVPAEVQYGKIVGHFVTFTADTGPDDIPEEIPIEGDVVLTPLTTILRYPTTTPPRLAIAQEVTAPVIEGNLCDPGELVPGVHVIATDQPNAAPNLVQWRARFRFKGVTTQPADIVFNVPSGGEVDLAVIAAVPPAPGTIVVVSHEDALAAAASADDAAQSAVEAAGSATGAADSATGADTSKTAAASSAAAAATSATNAANSAALAGAWFATVATAASLPAAAGNTGRSYYVIDTAVIVISDGTRWRTVYGDTGVRNVASLMTDPAIEQVSPVPVGRLRRVGHIVEFFADIKSTATVPSPFNLFTLPAGFKPTFTSYGALRAYSKIVTVVGNTSTGNLSVYAFTTNTFERFVGHWTTTDAWPTTLPGTAVGVPT